MIGQHLIEIVIKDEKIDATPGFYTYDASKIKVGEIPPGLVGMPVDFQGKKKQHLGIFLLANCKKYSFFPLLAFYCATN